MNQTSGDSTQEQPCVVCMSVGKGKELEVKSAGEKDTPMLEEGMYITLQDARVYENNTMRTVDGVIINLEKGAFQKLKGNEKERRKYQPKQKQSENAER